jgi:L-seryl-tRNA(Ser) seleniumtransferase
LVTASGDKLLGGPQCGLLLGRRDLVESLRRHPVARALRVDKLTLAALEATLRGPQSPVGRALETDGSELFTRAQALSRVLETGGVVAFAVRSQAAVGGGGAPGVTLPSAAVSVAASLAAPLRLGEPPVVGRLEQGQLLLDLIAVDPADDAELVRAVLAAVEA